MLKKILTIATFAASTVEASPARYQIPAGGMDDNTVFTVMNAEMVVEKNMRHLRFTLPEDLTAGKSTVVSLKEQSTAHGFTLFLGEEPGERASCEFLKRQIVCLVHYKSNVASDSDLRAFLKKKYQRAKVFESKLAMASRYNNEPAGVLTIAVKAEP